MRRLVAFFVDRSLLVNLLTVFVCAAGAIVATDDMNHVEPAIAVDSGFDTTKT